MNKIAIFTDLHLGVHQNSDFWLNVALEWADWFVSELKARNITEVIFCGDWMHYRDAVEVKTLHYHSLLVEKFKDFKLYMIPGNHCCYYKNTSDVHSLSIMKGHDNVVLFDKISSIYWNDRVLTFCPWGCNFEDIPKSDILFGHFELQNFKMNGFKICEHGDNPEALLSKASLIFSGHFHQRDEKHFNGNGSIIYVGNPFQTDFGDAYQSKGFYILDSKDLSYEFVENKLSPKHLKVSLSTLISNGDPNEFFSSIKGNIVKLVIDKNISTEHLDAIIFKMNTFKPADLKVDHDVNYSRIRVQDSTDIDVTSVDFENVITEFVEMLKIQNKEEVVKYTLSLYNRVTQ